MPEDLQLRRRVASDVAAISTLIPPPRPLLDIIKQIFSDAVRAISLAFCKQEERIKELEEEKANG